MDYRLCRWEMESRKDILKAMYEYNKAGANLDAFKGLTGAIILQIS